MYECDWYNREAAEEPWTTDSATLHLGEVALKKHSSDVVTDRDRDHGEIWNECITECHKNEECTMITLDTKPDTAEDNLDQPDMACHLYKAHKYVHFRYLNLVIIIEIILL